MRKGKGSDRQKKTGIGEGGRDNIRDKTGTGGRGKIEQ
jgi:hypothetical protein